MSMSHDGVGPRAVGARSSSSPRECSRCPCSRAAAPATTRRGPPAAAPGHRPDRPRPGRRRRHAALGDRRPARRPSTPSRPTPTPAPSGSPRPCCPRSSRWTRRGGPRRNPDYLEKAEVVEREPKQVVLYKLNQQAVWSDGREIGAADFVAQWRALNGKDSAYWTARNAGYERIEKIERGQDDLEVKVTFAKPYADWRSLFSPLYPRRSGHPGRLQRGGPRAPSRSPRAPSRLGRSTGRPAPSPSNGTRAGGARPAKLEPLVLTAVPAGRSAPPRWPPASSTSRRSTARHGRTARSRARAARPAYRRGRQPRPTAPGRSIARRAATAVVGDGLRADEGKAQTERQTRPKRAEAVRRSADQQKALQRLRRTRVPGAGLHAAREEWRRPGRWPTSASAARKARVLDRKELAGHRTQAAGSAREPGRQPPGTGRSAGVRGRQRGAGRAGHQGGAGAPGRRGLGAGGGRAHRARRARRPARRARRRTTGRPRRAPAPATTASTSWAQDDERNGRPRRRTWQPPRGAQRRRRLPRPPTAPTARSPTPTGPPRDAAGGRPVLPGAGPRAVRGRAGGGPAGPRPPPRGSRRGRQAQARPATARRGGARRSPRRAPRPPAKQAVRTSGSMLAKDGKALSLRFVLPDGPRIGVPADGRRADRRDAQEDRREHRDHQGRRRELLQATTLPRASTTWPSTTWPATAYPATDARPIFAKPEAPAADGSLLVEQNYTRVGTDHIDQLFDQAAGEAGRGGSPAS